MSEATPQVHGNSGAKTRPVQDDNTPLPVWMKTATTGYLALLISMVSNANSTQDLIADGMMQLSEAISNQTQAYSQAWMLVMNNPTNDAALLKELQTNGFSQSVYNQLSDLGKEQWDSLPQNMNNGQNPQLSVDTSTFNMHNTQYNQATTFFGGISSGLNDTTNNMTNQVSLDYQQIQMNTLAIQQTLVSAL